MGQPDATAESRAPTPRTPGRRRWSVAERFTLAEAIGITIVFIATLLGQPLLAVPVLLVPVAYVVYSHARRDAVSALSLYVAFLFFIPSVLILEPLGGSGTPANVLGMLLLLWWLYSRCVPGLGVARDRSPVRWAILAFGAAMMASYADMAFRTIYPEEISGADRGVLFFLGCSGIALIACDGVSSRARLDTLLRRLVMAAAAVATLGVYQFFTHFEVSTIHIPGLTQNQQLNDLIERSIFNRVAGTASHPIEFGVVMGMMLPLALHFALFSKRRQTWWWFACGVIAMGIPMSVSRSAIVTVAVGMLFLVPTWPAAWQKRGLWVGALFAIGMRFAIPGLLGTVKSLFTNIANDPSTTGRTQDYAVFGDLFRQRPIIGRGFFTFLPTIYTIFDNQYLVILVEMGLVGLLAMVAIFVSGIGAARSGRRASRDPATRHLGQALAGSIAGGMIAFGTFDGFSFPMASGLVFFLVGCAGALRRLTREEPDPIVEPSVEELAKATAKVTAAATAVPPTRPQVEPTTPRQRPSRPGRRRRSDPEPPVPDPTWPPAPQAGSPPAGAPPSRTGEAPDAPPPPGRKRYWFDNRS